ncbi:MAG: transaldolase family protein [Euryarchaeota archaeon]|nr:transaldolase family protein [Euryarchaeota archaeon]
MKIFIDTAKLKEIKEASSWGIVDGVTTNPSLIKKAMNSVDEEVSMERYIADICRAVDGPISLEVKSQEVQEMIKEAESLYKRFNHINNNVIIKIPVNTAMEENQENYEGIKAIKLLKKKKIPTNATLVMSPNQAWLAAKAGAAYVSPFLGRIDDYIRSNMRLERGKDFAKTAYYDDELIELIRTEKRKRILEKEIDTGIGEIYAADRFSDPGGIKSGIDAARKIKRIFDNYKFNTEIIAASIRNARQVMEVAEIGAEIATIPFTVITEMITHCKTQEGMRSFTEDIIPEYDALFK